MFEAVESNAQVQNLHASGGLASGSTHFPEIKLPAPDIGVWSLLIS